MEVLIEKPNGKQKVILDDKLFSIDPADLDRAMCIIGTHLVECGTIEAELRVEVARKEATLNKLEADKDSEIRIAAAGAGEKMTENKVKNMIISSPDYQLALESLRGSTKNANIMRWVMVALQKKADCLLSMSYRETKLIKLEK